MKRAWWGWASRGMTPERQRAVRVARERQIIAAASEQIFRFDLSDPATWPPVSRRSWRVLCRACEHSGPRTGA